MEFTLADEEKKILLEQARESITAELDRRKPEYRQPEQDIDSHLHTPCGAFVSLHKGRDLRGCIGRMTAGLPLIETVRIMAKEAAFGDPRFPPLRKDELEKCHIEISALSHPLSRPPNSKSRRPRAVYNQGRQVGGSFAAGSGRTGVES
jgi:AmmeMemoRadiSam system protein A